jgi:DNA-binding MarR family transcriptional regulator
MDRRTHEREIIEDGQLFIVKVNSDTGDVISKAPAKKRRDTSDYFKKGDFFTVHIRVCKMLLTKKEYGNLTFRLLFALMERIEFNNRIRTFRQADLARQLDSHQPDISKSLKILEKDEVIERIKHDYYFTPKFVRYVNDGSFGRDKKEPVDLSGINVDDIDPDQLEL